MLGFLRRRRDGVGGATIDDALWLRTLARLPFLATRGPEDLARLRELAARFLATKAISGAAGFEPDEDVRASIAVQACVPVLALGLEWYRDFVEVIVYPGAFVAPRRSIDDAGVVHEWHEELAGESMDGGPVVLSWEDVERARELPSCGGPIQPSFNVVIHEFAHKLDLADGEADGCPPMPRARRRAWRRALDEAFERFVEHLDAVEASIPRHVDPDGPAADRYYDALALDPYAATDEGEFFAVATEAFFVDNARFRAAFAALDEQMRLFYRQQP